MSVLRESARLSKELTLLHVFAISTGATLSAGLFLLPGLAAQQAGSAIVLCYVLAVVPLVPAMLCAAELGTAMPRAGGAYYFLDRSLGPLAGTIGGLGTWLALMLKASFALVGMGAYLSLYFPSAPHVLVACLFAVFFGLVNIAGGGSSGRFQLVLVIGLLAILAVFIGRGAIEIRPASFENMFDAGSQAIMATAGLVYVSYVGVTKVASVSEEIKNPDRNLPLGLFLSLGTAVVIYILCTAIMVAVVPLDELAGSYTPMAQAARILLGQWGMALITVAALLAFASVGNAAILASSRYPLAMSRDHLLPRRFRALSARSRTPVFSIVVTVAIILAFLVLLDPLRIAKLASAFQLIMFALLCVAVIVMRESRIESYDPGYRAPFYPWLQIVGIIAPLVFIVQMGWMPILFSSGMIVGGIAWYHYYGSRRVARHGAIYHVFERLARRRFYDLDRELRSILKEKGLRDKDPFEEVVAHAMVLDLGEPLEFEAVVDRASDLLGGRIDGGPAPLARSFMEGTRTGATPVSGGVALPHIRRGTIVAPELVLVRSVGGVEIGSVTVLGGTQPATTIHAIFFLVSPESDPGQHLRILAQFAQRVDEPDFLREWLAAVGEDALRQILVRDDRYLSLEVGTTAGCTAYEGRAIRELGLPEGCLVAVIRRGEEAIVPRGSTVLARGDRVTIIGEVRVLSELRATLGRT